jgi:LPXTG-site transpeptidase (sortase) family protein
MNPVTLLDTTFELRRSHGQVIKRLVQVFLAMVIAIGLIGVQQNKMEKVEAANMPSVSAVTPIGNILQVDNTSDDTTLSTCSSVPGDCSLRGAIEKANKQPGTETILLPAGTYKLHGDRLEDKNQTGDLDILELGGSLIVIGEDRDRTVIDGTGIDRIFDLPDYGSGISLTLANLTLSNGNASAIKDGGAIRTYGTLVLDNVNIFSSMARNGGAIYFHNPYNARISISNSTLSGNRAVGSGGALYLWGETVSINASLLESNEAALRGGAIYNNGQLSVVNSTLVTNKAPDGGGLYNWAFLGDNVTTRINNSTLWGNSGYAVQANANAVHGPITNSVVVISNTILAASSSDKNCKTVEKNDGNALIQDGGNNLETSTSCGFSSGYSTDPKLGSLQENGGRTRTLSLEDGSPAIDKANPSTSDIRDQRGLSAVGTRDIGAYEYHAKAYLSGTGGPARSAKVGTVLGSPLKVFLTNELGNPLVGWNVDFSVQDGSNVALSSNMVVSNDLGQGMVVAAPPENGAGPYVVLASAGGSTLKFTLTNTYAAPTGGSAKPKLLPATGFAPDRKQELPAQPAGKAYKAEVDMQLQIGKLGLSLPIVGVPKTEEGWDLTWLSKQAGYLEGTAFPTWEGNSVLTGHVLLADGSAGPFANLSSLKWGDQVVVSAWGQRYVYEVRSVEEVNPGDTRVMGHEDKAWLTLLTCAQYDANRGEYLKRLAVKAVLIKVE